MVDVHEGSQRVITNIRVRLIAVGMADAADWFMLS